MTIVEKEALQYKDKLINKVATIENIKNELTSKLYSFNRDKDKLYFLRVLQEAIEKDKFYHEEKCKTRGCTQSEEYNIMLFAIEQEHEDINRYFEPEIKKEDEFSEKEQISLHNKINEILDNLTSLKMGQELIYDEIDTLRQHFNLGKKNWFQLLNGKLFTLFTERIIDETILKDIYNQLSEGISSLPLHLNQ